MAEFTPDRAGLVNHYQPAPSVAWVLLDGAVYLAALPDPPILVLEGSAALIWQTALMHEPDGVVSEIARSVGEPFEVVRPSVVAFIDEMLTRGLLIEA